MSTLGFVTSQHRVQLYLMAPKNVLKVHAVSRVTLQHGIRGGMEYYFDFVVRGLANLGHSITVVSTEMATQPKMDDVVTFHPLPVGVGSREGPWAHKLLQYFEGLTPPPDAIISNSFAAAHLTRLEKPLVPIIHGSGFVDLISAFRLWSVGHESLMIILKELARVAKNSFFGPAKVVEPFLQNCGGISRDEEIIIENLWSTT